MSKKEDSNQISYKYLQNLVMNHAYEAARNGELELDGFPCFDTVVSELKTQQADGPEPRDEGYKVTAAVDGALIIKKAYLSKFQDMPDFDEVVQKHNEAFNPDNKVAEDATADNQQTSPAKPTVVKTEVVTQHLEGDMTREKLASLPNTLGPEIVCFVCCLSLSCLQCRSTI